MKVLFTLLILTFSSQAFALGNLPDGDYQGEASLSTIVLTPGYRGEPDTIHEMRVVLSGDTLVWFEDAELSFKALAIPQGAGRILIQLNGEIAGEGKCEGERCRFNIGETDYRLRVRGTELLASRYTPGRQVGVRGEVVQFTTALRGFLK